ncbi:MAG: hypothetical protein ACLTW9_07115 [Enterocloster sp.]
MRGTYDNFEQEVWLTGQYEGKYPKTDQYLSLMKNVQTRHSGIWWSISAVTDQPTTDCHVRGSPAQRGG